MVYRKKENRETQELLEQAPKDKKGTIDFEKEVLFTETILKELERFRTKEELLQLNHYLEMSEAIMVGLIRFILKM